MHFEAAGRWRDFSFAFAVREYEVDDLDENGNLFEVVAWCRENFGPAHIWTSKWPAALPKGRWCHTTQAFWFRDEHDALAFKLRWC